MPADSPETTDDDLPQITEAEAEIQRIEKVLSHMDRDLADYIRLCLTGLRAAISQPAEGSANVQ